MTNEELFEDLKQFIDSRISQSEARTDKRFEGVDEKFEGIDDKFEGVDKKFEKIEKKLDQIQTEMNDSFAAAGSAIVPVNDQLANHETRITALEAA